MTESAIKSAPENRVAPFFVGDSGTETPNEFRTELPISIPGDRPYEIIGIAGSSASAVFIDASIYVWKEMQEMRMTLATIEREIRSLKTTLLDRTFAMPGWVSDLGTDKFRLLRPI